MATGKKTKAKRLPIAKAWPTTDVGNKEFAQWAETHSLENLIGSGKRMSIFSAQPKTKPVRAVSDRLHIALRMPPEDLEAVRQLAREKDVSSSTLLRTWISQRLRREQRRAS